MSAPAPKGPRPERKFDPAYYLPSQSFLSLLLVVVAAGLLIVWPITTHSGRSTVTGGPVSNHHRLIEQQCEKCHSAPFAGTQDTACKGCHTVGEHAPSMVKLRATDKSNDRGAAACSGCHKEHHGQESLVPVDSPLCTTCHLRLAGLLPGSGAPEIADFAHHPEFAVRPSHKARGRAEAIPPGSATSPGSGAPSDGGVAGGDAPVAAQIGKRIRIGEPEALDNTPFKFSHAEHLAAHKGTSEKLTCPSCHQIGPDRRTMAPIDYRSRCQRCHELEFDERRPGDHVPHGDPDRAFEHIEAAVGRLIRNGNSPVTPSGAGTTTAPPIIEGAEPIPDGGAPDAGAASTPSRVTARIDAESRGDEGALFTEHRGCDRCHDVSESAAVVGKSRFHVTRPDIPVRWMAAARFDHAAHQSTACEHCHEKALSSTSASDLMLPGIAVCRECHADPGTTGMVESPCLQCHDYHAR